ncbi:SitI3 family protein [Streptomyces sp. NPDC087294]|uniref:SitI3 family protein n=1 Tax=Streptomyces sp. NPDC087294 TaxID=3365777 RepID=UPI0037F46513
MAIEYDLDLATRSSAAEIAARLLATGTANGVLDASVTVQQLLERGPFAPTRLGTRVGVVAWRPPRPWHPVVAGLGFTPTVGVGFRMARGVEVSDQQDDMLRLLVPLLARVDGDAVLHQDYEQVWLVRRGGELSLSENADLWRPARLALVRAPFRRETHTLEEAHP